MSFHDAIAERAFNIGKTSADFKTASRRHTWTAGFCASIAAIAVFTADTKWAIFLLMLTAVILYQRWSARQIASRIEKLEASQLSREVG